MLTNGHGSGVIDGNVYGAIASTANVVVFDAHEGGLVVEVVIDILNVEIDGLYFANEGSFFQIHTRTIDERVAEGGVMRLNF